MPRRPSLHKSIILYGCAVLALALVVSSQAKSLPQTWKALSTADALLVFYAAFVVLLTFVAGALAYLSLARRQLGMRVRFAPTLLVQVASGFTNRLLPAGLGGMGIFAAYLRKRGATLAAATGIVVTNNLLGLIGNLLLVAGLLVVRPSYLQTLKLPQLSVADYAGIGFGLVMLVTVVLLYRAKRSGKLAAYFKAAAHTLLQSLSPNKRTAFALTSNMVLTSLNAVVLSLSVAAVGGNCSWAAALLVLSLGTLVGAAVPTPGGLGGVEAGLLAGLYVFGVPTSIGFAAVLIYRLLTFWLPIIPGIVAFRYFVRRYI